MTNGEKLKEIFPNGVLTSINNSYYWGDDILVSKNWWNAEYQEPTTKGRVMTREEAIKIFNEVLLFGKAHCTQAEFEELARMAIKALEQEPTTKNTVDWDELKRRIFMEVDGGTGDNWLRYADVCDNISDSIDEFVSDMREVEE